MLDFTKLDYVLHNKVESDLMFLMLLLKDIINKLHLYVVMVEQHVEALLFKEEHDLLVAERAELRTRLVELQQEQVTPETAQLQFRH